MSKSQVAGGGSNYTDRRPAWRIRGWNRYPKPAKLRNTPKAQRERLSMRPAAPLADPIRTLGHPARGRRHH